MKLLAVRAFRFISCALIASSATFGCSKDDSTGGGPNGGPQSSSATHFLENCNGPCAGGFECVCGSCTRACTSSTECRAISDGTKCVVTADAHPACSATQPAHVCDQSCTADDDCKGLASAPHC